jgi:hypothetical protein
VQLKRITVGTKDSSSFDRGTDRQDKRRREGKTEVGRLRDRESHRQTERTRDGERNRQEDRERQRYKETVFS